MSAKHGGFHWRDGWYFERIKDGGVMVYRRREPEAPAEPVLAMPANEWASIVASLTARGETTETYYAALAFHNATEAS